MSNYSDYELPTPYKKAAIKVRPPKGCGGNSGKEHYYVHDMVVCHSGNSIGTKVLWEHNMKPFCLLCGKQKRGAESDLNKVIHVRNWYAEEREEYPSRKWSWKVIS